ncbi:MAG: hypothetical protein M0T72_00030 [Candidatus Dormibacteraeota bacterium]|nr:hypothetical protein [Candidatus Dormibacteraeota bacterium]
MAGAIATAAPAQVLTGSYLDELYRLLQDIDEQLRCLAQGMGGSPSQLASQWSPIIRTVPAAAPNVDGILLVAADSTRKALRIHNMDTATTLYMGSTPAVGYPGGLVLTGEPVLPGQTVSWNLTDADRGLAYYGIALGAPIDVSVATAS